MPRVNRTRARRLIVVAGAAASLLTLTGCGAGLGANTSTPYDPVVGSDAVIGHMYVDNVVVVDDGNVPELEAVLINQGSVPDTLMSLEVTGATDLTLPSGGIDVPPTNFVAIGPDSTQRLVMSTIAAGLGHVVNVTMLFRIAGSVTVPALVLPPSGLTSGG